MPSFANPAGLWALIGIPAIIAIHFLQRKALVLPISTLFLLEKTQRDAATGRRFDRIVHSVPLWMQLLAVLLLTWLLTEPRFALARSTQRIAIVLDDSASMLVFKEKLITELESRLPALQGMATDVEYTLLPSTPTLPKLYAGTDKQQLLAALRAWQPIASMNDPAEVLRLARSLVSQQGHVIFATDNPVSSLPFGASLLSIGEKIDNVGFTGAAFEEKDGTLLWRATIQNYADQALTRTWHVESPGLIPQPKAITIPARSLVTIQSNFPTGTQRVSLHLTSDPFPLDDVLPLVRPAPKTLQIDHPPNLQALATKLQRAISHINIGTTPAPDVTLVSYDPLDPTPVTGHAIIFVKDPTQGGKYLAGGIIAEKHPLMDGINWQSLLIRETIPLHISKSDQGLLYQDKRPLIALRTIAATEKQPAAKQLLFNFDPRLSNIESQPALIVCLLRYFEMLRAEKVAPAQVNLETQQSIALATRKEANAPPLTLEFTDVNGKVTERANIPLGTLRAPSSIGFQQWRQGDEVLLTTATAFADTREADFRDCAAQSNLETANAQAIQAHSKLDPWWRHWLLALTIALLASWFFMSKRPTEPVATRA